MQATRTCRTNLNNIEEESEQCAGGKDVEEKAVAANNQGVAIDRSCGRQPCATRSESQTDSHRSQSGISERAVRVRLFWQKTGASKRLFPGPELHPGIVSQTFKQNFKVCLLTLLPRRPRPPPRVVDRGLSETFRKYFQCRPVDIISLPALATRPSTDETRSIAAHSFACR